jgi:hypothetical protein
MGKFDVVDIPGNGALFSIDGFVSNTRVVRVDNESEFFDEEFGEFFPEKEGRLQGAVECLVKDGV